MTQEVFELVRLANGTASVRYADYSETLHPVAGPEAEAQALYARQLRLPERMRAAGREFVVWDVGMGIAANALTVARALAGCQGTLRLVSFDDSIEPLRFALARAAELPHLHGFEPAVADLLAHGRSRFRSGLLKVEWSLVNADFPKALAERSAGDWPVPDAILFDPFSPAVNSTMWTLELFQNLFARLDPQRACNLATYSRTTFVAQPLDRRWLERARRSHSAEPLREPVYRQAPLAARTWEQLWSHPQFS